MKVSVKQRSENIWEILAGYWLDQPKDNQSLVENKLTVSGWIIGKHKAVEKIRVSGAACFDIPINLQRPDVQVKQGNIGTPLIIDDVETCGFYKQVFIDDMPADGVCEIQAVFADGEEALIDVIEILQKPATMAEASPAPPVPTKLFVANPNAKKKKNRRR